MDAVYLICLLVGGFFVALSIFGGGESEADADTDLSVDVDADVDADFDVSVDSDADFDHDFDHDVAHEIGAGPGFVDLFSLRAIFLFAAFFGLTGVLLQWVGTAEPMRFLFALGMGLVSGLGGNYVIKRVGYQTVSSSITQHDLVGKTAKVTIPIEGTGKGKISLVAKSSKLQLVAEAYDELTAFEPGDEVVVVGMNGRVAQVIKPD